MGVSLTGEAAFTVEQIAIKQAAPDDLRSPLLIELMVNNAVNI
jgi:hypothetical protein